MVQQDKHQAGTFVLQEVERLNKEEARWTLRNQLTDGGECPRSVYSL